MGSPHLEEELIGGDCRSRSPLQKPSKRCKNHRRDGRGSKVKRTAMVVSFRALGTLKTIGEEAPFIGKANVTVGAKTSKFGGQFGAAGPAAGPSGEQFGGHRKTLQNTSSADSSACRNSRRKFRRTARRRRNSRRTDDGRKRGLRKR